MKVGMRSGRVECWHRNEQELDLVVHGKIFEPFTNSPEKLQGRVFNEA